MRVSRADKTVSRAGQPSRSHAVIIRSLVALSIAFVLIVVPLSLNLSGFNAFANVYPANETAQVEGDQNSVSSSSDSAEAAADSDEGESIEDDETPMSSGLDGAELLSPSFSFAPVAIAGIIGVAAFFGIIINRTNGSIRDLNRMFK